MTSFNRRIVAMTAAIAALQRAHIALLDAGSLDLAEDTLSIGLDAQHDMADFVRAAVAEQPSGVLS